MNRWILAFGALAVVAAECSSTGTVDGPVLTSRSELFGPSGGMAAEVTGVLVYDEPSNCLLMELGEFGIHWSGQPEPGGKMTRQ